MMGKSPHTIVQFKRRIRDKTGAHRVAHMVIWAIQNGLYNPNTISLNRIAQK